VRDESVIVEIKGNIPAPVHEINPHHDMFITHHHQAIASRRVEVAFGAVHVFMSQDEADGLGKNLQALSGKDQMVHIGDGLDRARAILDVNHTLTSTETASRCRAALQEVIGYLIAQRPTQWAGT
jgi:hypothetical protein